ncbi:hypothetical protein PHYBOEH_007723 [Phytophthora boehmeriae]|uniref:M96 mating-specific protein family n=1 Tax=Phytophthora boehmeriae TaxID=109152 RepID=A0A8T1X0R7_9STRA|nr:hypothetical protein PHYBOEH_007723 [Phytophthora boehmeriae]
MALVPDDDDAALEAALAFLDEFQEAEADVGDVEEAKRRRQVERNERKKLLRRAGVYADPNRVRNERRKEIIHLQREIERLQIDLQTLQTTGRQSGPRQRREAAVCTQLSTVWREIAGRQQTRRGAAEREHLRLKRALQRQRKVAENLKNLIQKRARQLVWRTDECSCLTSLSCRKHQIVHVRDLCGDIGEFQGLFSHNVTAYREMDAIFDANGLANMVVSACDVHIREGNGGKYLELFANKVLPFELRDVTEATWEHFSGTTKHMANGSLYEKAAKNLDEPYTIIEDFTKETFYNNSRADLKVKQVVRRYVEDSRDVIIWTARISSTAVKHKILCGLTYNLRGYLVTKRSSASTPEREVSQLQSCSLLALDQEAETSYGLENLRTLTNFLTINSAQNMRAHQAYIENALVDRALRRRIQ